MRSKIRLFFRNNSLYTNSLYLLMGNGITIGTGFIFWIIAARLYHTEQIGIATALYSLMTLLSSLSTLGFNVGLMHYLPTSQYKSEKINSSLIITITTSALVTLIAVLLLPSISPHLAFVTHNGFFFISFIVFTVIQTLNVLIESILVAFRKAIHVIVKNSIFSVLKLILPFFFIVMGAYGVFSSIGIATLAGVIYGFIIIAWKCHISYELTFHKQLVKKMSFFSFGNYISGIAATTPNYILPIFITNMLGPSSSAYYYIVATTANILFLMPQLVTQNLLVEGSYNESEIKTHSKKALRLIVAMLLPATFCIILFGNYVLLVFGKTYSTAGLQLLQLFAISSLFLGINYILRTIIILLHKITLLIVLSIINAVLVLFLSYAFISMGLTGIGIAAIITQIILIMLHIIVFISIKKTSLLFALF